MIFNDYCTKLTHILQKQRINASIVDRNLDKIFECYINSISEFDCAKKLTKPINETKSNTVNFNKYAKRVITILETMGYKKEEIDDTITDKIVDSYDIDEDEYACAEICQDTIEKEAKNKPIKLTKDRIETIRNSLIFNLHNVNNAALLDLNVSPHAASVQIKVRLIHNLNEIQTDVKSYIKMVHKYLSSFLVQNVNTSIEAKLQSYAIKFNNLYCTTQFTIPLILPDGTPTENFNIPNISANIKSYLNVLETFAEQYQNIIK